MFSQVTRILHNLWLQFCGKFKLCKWIVQLFIFSGCQTEVGFSVFAFIFNSMFANCKTTSNHAGKTSTMESLWMLDRMLLYLKRSLHAVFNVHGKAYTMCIIARIHINITPSKSQSNLQHVLNTCVCSNSCSLLFLDIEYIAYIRRIWKQMEVHMTQFVGTFLFFIRDSMYDYSVIYCL